MRGERRDGESRGEGSGRDSEKRGRDRVKGERRVR